MNKIEEINKAFEEIKQYKHLHFDLSDGQSLTILINGKIGWIMYIRQCEDSGFSTRNPQCKEILAKIDYILENGQRDQYPACWAYPVAILKKAAIEFVKTNRLPICVSWHDDSLKDEK